MFASSVHAAELLPADALREIYGVHPEDVFIPLNGPFTQLINATSCVKIWEAMIEEEEL